jgi:uncharacterized protein involved in exopolysaccharide biosynthesis
MTPIDRNSLRKSVPTIDLSKVFRAIIANLRFILMCSVGFGIAGAIYSLLAQKEFDSKATILPELASSTSLGKIGGLSALAGLAGVDMGAMSSTEAVRPDLYPNVLQSFPFALHILNQPVYISDSQKTMKLSEYYNQLDNKWYSGLKHLLSDVQPTTIPAKDDPTIQLSREQEYMIEWVQERITSVLDRKTGIITINSQMPDATAAAITARLTVEYLKDYVKGYRTEKGRTQVEFLTKQMNRAKAKYQSSEAALAGFKDRNRVLSLQIPRIEEQRIQSDYMLAQSLYNSVVNQLEQAKIKVAEDTPVLKILEPARVPARRSSPRRTLIVLGACVVGFIVGMVLKVSKEFTDFR